MIRIRYLRDFDQFILNFQCVKWDASSSSNLMLSDVPFVAKHKNNYKLLRKIHYLEKKKKFTLIQSYK